VDDVLGVNTGKRGSETGCDSQKRIEGPRGADQVTQQLPAGIGAEEPWATLVFDELQRSNRPPDLQQLTNCILVFELLATRRMIGGRDQEQT
jgi:hypothetical protein